MISLIQSFSRHRATWVALLILGVILEGLGLYFQYGLRLDPCVNCVYERALFLSFIIAGLIGFMAPGFFITRITAILIFMAGSIGGVLVAFAHVTEVYGQGFGGACKLKADFPQFLKLDELLPWMFRPTGSCGPLDWSFLGLGMPEWILAAFSCGTLVSTAFFVGEFFKRKRKHYLDYYR